MINRVALVTGANQGIGYEIAVGLLKEPNLIVLVGARNPDRGKEALEKLNSPHAKFLQLNIDSNEEITNAAQHVKDTYGGLDILVNNAAIAWSGNDWNEEVVRTTLHTNYFQTKKMIEVFGPLIRENGRIVNLSSTVGFLSHTNNEVVRSRLADPTLTPERIDALANEFINAVIDGSYEQKGWRKSAYGISKTLLNCYSRWVIANTATLYKPGVKVYVCCPGYCNTRMTKGNGIRPASKGAETPVWLALQPPDTQLAATWYQDQKPLDW